MCGIAGFLARTNVADASLRAVALDMANQLEHRGPDDFGVWADAGFSVAFGHRRLSIQDLSSAGRQPMGSENGRYLIVYNGEIYNFRELRGELEGLGHGFRGRSDTEVLLAAIAEWGVREALAKLNGMFAFALWDRERGSLTLVRDRAGKKPLYYGWCGTTFLFASELKALGRHPAFDGMIDRDALALFLTYGWLPGPYTIFRHIRKLSPGTLLNVAATDDPWTTSPEVYWSARDVVEAGARTPFSGSVDKATDRLEELLLDAVEKRMIADVSLGALLSGGIDSTLIVALMQSLHTDPVKTFTIGFHETKHNEAEFAKAIARYLGTDHTELYVSPQDSLDVIPDLAMLYDEPFADPSQIPTLLVSRLARGEVKVALSGDGGDELFAGYNRYRTCLRTWRRWGDVPWGLRRGIAGGAARLAGMCWNLMGPSETGDPVPLARWRRLPARLDRKLRPLSAESPVEMFGQQRTRWASPEELVAGARPIPSLITQPGLWPRIENPLRVMMFLDLAGYLPDDNLVKVDRASMAVSLEVRNPLLDHRIVEFACTLPTAMLIGGDGGKLVLRRLLERYVPRRLTDRPKRGFGVPIAEWLRDPLRKWAETLLDPGRLESEGYLNAPLVRRVWHEHLSLWRDRTELLWHILMFQTWLEAWSSGATARERPAAAAVE